MRGRTDSWYEQLDIYPRRSSKNCDLQFANNDIIKIDIVKENCSLHCSICIHVEDDFNKINVHKLRLLNTS